MAAATCFHLLAAPEAPFPEAAIAKFTQYYSANFNINGTGAIMASPGATPALDVYNIPGGYRFHWMRDGALSMASMLDTMPVTNISDEHVRATAKAYVGWVASLQQLSTDIYAKPKWEIPKTLTEPKVPYGGGWCDPQTDGPPLRARTLLRLARQFERGGLGSHDLFALAAMDLDWVSSTTGGSHFDELSCDLWEETTDDGNLLWNRVAMRAALLEGASVAAARSTSCLPRRSPRRHGGTGRLTSFSRRSAPISTCRSTGTTHACCSSTATTSSVRSASRSPTTRSTATSRRASQRPSAQHPSF